MAAANGVASWAAGGTAGSTCKDSIKVSELDGKAPESTDYANYFCTYAFLYHQVRCLGRPQLASRGNHGREGFMEPPLKLFWLRVLHWSWRPWPPRTTALRRRIGLVLLQKDMLEDHKRTGAYFQAVMQNRRQFSGKTVLDVGTGSGILAIFAARAGARKVYAVEATSMAQHARRLVEHNGVRTAIIRSKAYKCAGRQLTT